MFSIYFDEYKSRIVLNKVNNSYQKLLIFFFLEINIIEIILTEMKIY